MRHRRRLLAGAGLVLGLSLAAAAPALSDVGEHSKPVGTESRPGCGFVDENHVHVGPCREHRHHDDGDNENNGDNGDGNNGGNQPDD